MSFILEERGGLKYFVPGNIKAAAAFATRLGGVSGGGEDSPLYNLNLGFKKKYDTDENVRKNYDIIADAVGFSVNNIIYAHQKHTDNILVCGENFLRDNKNNMLPLPEDYIYDAMVTDIPGILLTVRIADCAPVLFWDEEHNAVGAAHCGWRGTLNKLQVRTALKMREIYGTSLRDLKVAIGPCISKCCYEVSGEFYEDFVNTLGERVKIYFRRGGVSPPANQTRNEITGGKTPPLQTNNKYMCDLKGINKMLLLSDAQCAPLQDKIDENNIEISPDCTYCGEDLFFSHRRQGECRGTLGAFIGLSE